jgi:two-component system sensor histidine kinase UhpB
MTAFTDTALDPLGILRSAMDAIITIDESENIVLFNAAAERIFGWPVAAVIGAPLERLIPERFRAAHHGHIRRFGETGVTTRMMGPRLNLLGLRASGEEFPIDASISQVTVGGEKFYTVILRDVSERRRAEEALERSYSELRELSRVMNEVREAERTRVARELHDELAQWLTALKMDIAWLAARLPAGDGGVLDRTERMKKVVDTTVASVRRIAADLRPVMLDDLGLVPSIEHLLQAVAERANLAATLDVPAEGFDFRDPLATSVYRMIQEALTNVARHARATKVRVTLAREGDALLIRVTDNGVGLGQPAHGRKSYGLLGIRERAQTLGGHARIYSPAEGGTVVEILIPLVRFSGAEAAA